LTRAERKRAARKDRKSLGRRVGENLRAAGELGRDAWQRPGTLPDRAHGWFRAWFRKVWDLRGGGLYAVGFAAAFLYFEIRELFLDDIPQFIAMNNVFSSEIVDFGIQFFVDSMVNFVSALAWPAFVALSWPPVGAIALGAAFILFPRTLKKPIERWLFEDDRAPPT